MTEWKMQEKKEVEQTFEVGDWFITNQEIIRRIVEVNQPTKVIAAINECGYQVSISETINGLIKNYGLCGEVIKVEPVEIKDGVMYFKEV